MTHIDAQLPIVWENELKVYLWLRKKSLKDTLKVSARAKAKTKGDEEN